MKITLSNEIRIEDPTKELLEWIRRNLVLANPEYAKRKRMGLWTGSTEEYLWLYRVDGNIVYLPCGVGKKIRPFLRETDRIRLDLADNPRPEFPGRVPLYDYQEEAVEAMKAAGSGILKSPCGSGKTQMGIALAARLKRRTLWITHTADLLKQSYDRARQYFPEKVLGIITAGQVQMGSCFTFATVQTLSKLDLKTLKYQWDIIIVDECHRVSGTPVGMKMFYRVMNRLAARNKFGLSATLYRSDGMIPSTFAVLGEVQYQVPEEAVAEKTIQVRIRERNTGIQINRCCLDTDGTLVYGKLLPYLIENEERNRIIGADLMSNRDHYNLILSDRLEHLRRLREMLPEDLIGESVMIDGTMTSKRAKAQRIQAIEEMRQGKKHFLFASYSLAKEGLDIPRLDRLYLATPKKDPGVVTQAVGRIARVFEGKTEAICYDYVDAIGFCENQFKRRKTSYRKAGCLIC